MTWSGGRRAGVGRDVMGQGVPANLSALLGGAVCALSVVVTCLGTAVSPHPAAGCLLEVFLMVCCHLHRQ